METNTDDLDGFVNEEEQKSIKNIGTKWLDSLYNSIEKITEHERYGREGCESLVQYVQDIILFNKSLSSTQLKNLSMMIGEIKIILPKAKRFIKEKAFGDLLLEIKKCDIDFNNQYVFVKKTKYLICILSKGKKNSSSLFLKQGFGILFERVVEVKVKLLDELDEILFPKGKVIKQMEV